LISGWTFALALLVVAGLAYGFGVSRHRRLRQRLVTALELSQEVSDERQQQLLRDNDLFASIIRGMNEGVILVDADRRVRLVNRRCREILGIDFDPANCLLSEIARYPELNTAVDRMLAGDEASQNVALRLYPTGGAFDVRSYRLSRGEVLLLLFDISQLERLESVRREFVANVSHELRTPLTAVQASVESLEEMESTTAEQRPFLDIAARNSAHMGLLVSDLTDLSVIETGAVSLEIQSLDLFTVASAVAERLGTVARDAQIDVRVESGGPVPIDADRRRLEQILTNLLDNALKFTPGGGRVTLQCFIEGDEGVFSITDTGEGIPFDSQEQIFHRFFQVRKERSRTVRGTGLGLAIVKHLMRLHNGQVQLTSVVGEGTTFTLRFPRAGTRKPDAGQ